MGKGLIAAKSWPDADGNTHEQERAYTSSIWYTP